MRLNSNEVAPVLARRLDGLIDRKVSIDRPAIVSVFGFPPLPAPLLPERASEAAGPSA